MQQLCCGEDEQAFLRRAAASHRDRDELRTSQLGGTVPEVVDRLCAYADVGVDRIYLQILDLSSLEHLRLVAERVMPALR